MQNIMADKTSDLLFETLYKQKGHMYVCGDVTMAADVLKTLHGIFAKVGKMTEAEAAAAIKEIKVTRCSFYCSVEREREREFIFLPVHES